MGDKLDRFENKNKNRISRGRALKVLKNMHMKEKDVQQQKKTFVCVKIQIV